jgi:pimeloyl-ACP methyl ester carboxylesterase/uncharacterized membrane protein YhdT
LGSWLLVLGVGLGLLASLGWPAQLAAAAPAPDAGPPQFEAGPCPFALGAIPPGERVDCGDLVVPEDRSQADSPNIQLAVAILRTPNPAPAPDPILFLADGPGGSGLDWLSYFLTRAPDLRADRDIILLDQRGTGHSQPSLRCSEFDSLTLATQARKLSLAEARALDVQTATACHDRLAAAGVNLAAYTTAASATDIKDLRLALGYLSWNLYGIGYGARLAQAVLRDYPDGVRSVILDGVPPPQVAWWESSAANLNRALSALFKSCALQPACAAAFPNLATTFLDAVDRLNAGPLSAAVPAPVAGGLTPVLITGPRLVAGTTQVLLDGQLGLVPYLPLVITQLDTGNAAVGASFVQALPLSADPRRTGLWYSVQCHEEAPYNDPGRIQTDADSFARLRDYVLSDTTLAVCPGWGAAPADLAEKQAVRSDVPALVLAGEYDPTEPPTWSQLAASTLSRSFYYLLSGVGHGASLQGCGHVLAAQFIEAPDLAPRPACAVSGSVPAFVTAAYLNPGIPRVAQQLVQRFDTQQALPFLVCLGVFVTALLAWPVAALFRHSGSRMAGLARWLATVTLLLDLLFAGALIALVVVINQQQPELLLFGLRPEAAPLLAVPWVAGALTVGVLGLTLLAWKDGYWSLAGRVHYTLVAAAAAGFIGLVYAWGLIH